MSQYTYVVNFQTIPADDVASVFCNELARNVPWDFPDFKIWNAALPTPYVLSVEQTQLKAMRALPKGALATATPAQIGLILERLLQATNTGVV